MKGKEYWRSLEEFAATPEFQELLAKEYPRGIDWPEADAMTRRRFLTLMAASLGLAGLAGCWQPPAERILPYVRQPEEIVQGESLYFATSMTLAGFAQGLLVRSFMGRPIKVEGNPDHPANPLPIDAPQHARFGPTDLYAQASVLSLYDPDRAQTVMHLGNISTWDAVESALRAEIERRGGERRVRIRLLTQRITSPTLLDQIRRFRERFPQGRWHVHEPVDSDNARAGAQQAFGEVVDTHYRFDQADVILSLDADFLSCGPGHLRYLRDFSSRRRTQTAEQRQRMNRLYAVESTPSLTGAKADHRLAVRPSEVAGVAAAIAARLNVDRRGVQASTGRQAWVNAVADDLRTRPGRSIVIAGDGQPGVVHSLAHAINDGLGNVGTTLYYTAPTDPGGANSLPELCHDMQAGEVDILIILGGNPAYTAPADLNFFQKIDRVPLRIHLGLYNDETSAVCHWHIPEHHYLESWGDARAFDGTISMIQPLIAPLYDGRSACEALALLTGQDERSGYEIVRGYWRALFEPTHSRHQAVRESWERLGQMELFAGSFEDWWRRALHEGFVADSALPRREVTLRPQPGAEHARNVNDRNASGLEMIFRPDAGVFDGRFANNGWLQELPKPLTKLTWDNAALLSPATAVAQNLASEGTAQEATGKLVRLELDGRSVDAAVLVLPGHADGCVTVHLGYGRTRAGRVAVQTGFNAYRLRTSTQPWSASGLQIRNLGRRYPLATTQHHFLMQGRDLVRSGTVHGHQENQDHPHGRVPLSLFPAFRYEGQQWGMAIDLTLCTGCSACIVACQSENNIPIVGKEEVSRGREMHWLRVDTYYRGEADQAERLETYHQPVPCMQCENAPCELVCPVEATAHSSDGLNDMVYNRCVGTRYCSNNCPYKVRRFNFLQYADFETPSLRLMQNPDVTVRSRGVMEKCTYCVQRIRHGEIEARRENRPILDGEIMTACQAACPAGAIVFGDLNSRPRSQVAERKSSGLNYELLEDLNTRPRTTYLAAVRNPNPAL